MKCYNCNYECDEDSAFCGNCGANLRVSSIPSQSAQSQGEINNGYPYRPAEDSYNRQNPVESSSLYSGPKTETSVTQLDPLASDSSESDASQVAYKRLRNKMITVATSASFKAAVILVTIAVVWSFVSSGSGVMGTIMSILDTLGLGDLSDVFSEMNSGLDILGGVFSGASQLSKIIEYLPDILILVGLWMVFICSSSEYTLSTSATGLKIIKVVKIVQCVFSCITYLVTLVGLAGLGSMLEDIAAYGIIFCIIAIAVQIILCKALCDVISSAIDACEGYMEWHGSSVLAVLYMIWGVILFLVGLPFANIPNLCEGAALLIFGLLIMKFKEITEKNIMLAQSD